MLLPSPMAPALTPPSLANSRPKHTVSDMPCASSVTTHPLVSVIIPAFNDQHGVGACMAALVKQHLPGIDTEVIVVDNGSDPPLTIDPAIMPRPQLIRCLNPGAYAARNAGIEAARGNILAFTDADCIPDPNWIRAGVNALETCGDRCIVGGEVAIHRPIHPTATELYQTITGFGQRDNIERLGFSVTANLFVRRHQFNQIGGFNESLLSGGDLEWSWRASAAGCLLRYAPDAIVRTQPRKTLTDAIRQTRRVAGGRLHMNAMTWASMSPPVLGPKRTAFQAACWILRHPDLDVADRVRVFVVATILKLVHTLETLRLRLGGKAERR